MGRHETIDWVRRMHLESPYIFSNYLSERERQTAVEIPTHNRPQPLITGDIGQSVERTAALRTRVRVVERPQMAGQRLPRLKWLSLAGQCELLTHS
jgi:hypothetical protein